MENTLLTRLMEPPFRKSEFHTAYSDLGMNTGDKAICFVVRGIVVAGSYEHSSPSNDTRRCMEIYGSGDVIGLPQLTMTDSRLDEYSSRMFAKTVSAQALCYFVSVENFNKAVKKWLPNERYEFLGIAGRSVLKQERKIESLVFEPSEQRIIKMLLSLGTDDRFSRQIGYERLISGLKMTHQTLAYLTGTSRQTVTTLMTRLKKQNYIYAKQRNSILIRDMQSLRELSESYT